MIYQVGSFFDSKARVYSRPFFVQDFQLFSRVAADTVNADNDISRHPEDFALFHIGSFDDATGVLERLDVPVCLHRMHEVKVRG